MNQTGRSPNDFGAAVKVSFSGVRVRSMFALCVYVRVEPSSE